LTQDIKNSAPLISIVIPTFNSGITIKNCLDSIQAQTFRDFEVLIIDSISSDNTLEIVGQFKDNISINIFSEKDKGIYDAMNRGIRLAKGEWIYFLGSDDTLFTPDTLMQVAKELKATDAEVVYGNVMSERFSGVYAGEFDKKKIFNNNICHQSVFFNKSVFQKIGDFNLHFKANADYDHNLKWFLSDTIKHKFIDIIIANYAAGGFSSQSDDLDFQKIKKWKYSFLTRKQIGKRAKMKINFQELISAMKEGRGRDFFGILFRSPRFLLNL